MKSKITSFVLTLLKSVPVSIPFQVLICTNENDPIQGELDGLMRMDPRIQVIYSQLSSCHAALTSLSRHTFPESKVLTLSVGIQLSSQQIQRGFDHVTDAVRVYGWKVGDYGNDGKIPGKGWYHTAAILDPTIVKIIKDELPIWIDNNQLGAVGNYTLGGNEEIPIMVLALQKDKNSQFILNVSDPVSSTIQLGTGITYAEKLERKVHVSKIYLEKMHKELHVTSDLKYWTESEIWGALKLI